MLSAKITHPAQQLWVPCHACNKQGHPRYSWEGCPINCPALKCDLLATTLYPMATKNCSLTLQGTSGLASRMGPHSAQPNIYRSGHGCWDYKGFAEVTQLTMTVKELPRSPQTQQRPCLQPSCLEAGPPLNTSQSLTPLHLARTLNIIRPVGRQERRRDPRVSLLF